MNTHSALELALELQEKTLDLQQGLQRLIRQLTEDGRVTRLSNRPASRSPSSEGAADSRISLPQLDDGDFRYTKPRMLYLPDGSEARVQTWKEMVVRSIGWLIDDGQIDHNMPSGNRRKHPVVARNKSDLSHKHGDPDNYIVQYGNWSIDTWGNVNTKARNLMAVYKEAGIDPAEIQVDLRGS